MDCGQVDIGEQAELAGPANGVAATLAHVARKQGAMMGARRRGLGHQHRSQAAPEDPVDRGAEKDVVEGARTMRTDNQEVGVMVFGSRRHGFVNRSGDNHALAGHAVMGDNRRLQFQNESLRPRGARCLASRSG